MNSTLESLILRTLPALPRGLVARVASPYIAGENEEEAIALACRLAERGYATTLDLLGEHTTDMDAAARTAVAYTGLMAAMATAGLDRNISIKLTQLGLKVDREQAFAELTRVLEAAGERDFFVRIDMEDASVTQATLDLTRRARLIWPRVGTVLQARLRRTVDDARQLAAEGMNVRLCKGIYDEPEEIAFQRPSEVRESFLVALEELLAGDGYTAIATHDVPLIEEIEARFVTAISAPGRAEFQALLGVPIGTTLDRLRDAGHLVRLYLPFGSDWYAYSLRRLKENPRLAGEVARGVFSGDRLEVER